MQKTPAIHPAPGESLDDALARIEGELITGALEQSGFNLTRAAEQLKLTRHSLRYRMQRLNMNLGDGAASEPPDAAEQKGFGNLIGNNAMNEMLSAWAGVLIVMGRPFR